MYIIMSGIGDVTPITWNTLVRGNLYSAIYIHARKLKDVFSFASLNSNLVLLSLLVVWLYTYYCTTQGRI